MGQQPGKGRQSYRCAYSPNPPPHPSCLSASAGSRSASGFPLAPALELGISKIQLHRPIAAGAFLLGLPEGGTSEWEALPARLAVPGSSLVQTGSLTAVPGWGEWARICNYFNLLELGGSSQNSGDKEEGRTFRTEYICCLSWTWLTLNSVCDLEQIT